MRVELTFRPAKGRNAGFEGREGHRTKFASGVIIGSGAGGFQRGMLGAQESRDEAVERRGGADFIVDVR